MTTRGLRTPSRASSEPGNDGGRALGPGTGIEPARLAAHPGLPKRIHGARGCQARRGRAAEGTQRRRPLGAIRECTTAPPKVAGRGENGMPLYPQRRQRANQSSRGELEAPTLPSPRGRGKFQSLLFPAREEENIWRLSRDRRERSLYSSRARTGSLVVIGVCTLIIMTGLIATVQAIPPVGRGLRGRGR